jgi:hypothetical protein
MGTVETMGSFHLQRMAECLLLRHHWLAQATVVYWIWHDPIDDAARSPVRLGCTVSDVVFEHGSSVPREFLAMGRADEALAERALSKELAGDQCEHYNELVEECRLGERTVTVARSQFARSDGASAVAHAAANPLAREGSKPLLALPVESPPLLR